MSGHAGLQRKTITVHRAGKTIHQQRWVRSDSAEMAHPVSGHTHVDVHEPGKIRRGLARAAQVALPAIGAALGSTAGSMFISSSIGNVGQRVREAGRDQVAANSGSHGSMAGWVGGHATTLVGATVHVAHSAIARKVGAMAGGYAGHRLARHVTHILLHGG